MIIFTTYVVYMDVVGLACAIFVIFVDLQKKQYLVSFVTESSYRDMHISVKTMKCYWGLLSLIIFNSVIVDKFYSSH